jgi:hypothetical protein
MARLKYRDPVTGEYIPAKGGGAASRGRYELIDTVTLAEKAAIYMTTEPDGTPYNFSRIFVKLTSTGPQPAATWHFDRNTGGNRIISCYMSAQTSESTSYAGIQMWKENGYFTGESYAWRAVATTYGSTNHVGDTSAFYTTDDRTIKAFRSDTAFNAGMKVEIWAVRA